MVILCSASITVLLLVLSGCASTPGPDQSAMTPTDSRNPEDFFVVDCLLPGQVRQLGQKFTFMAPRQAVKTTAFDCGLRGGEFTAYNRASYQTALKVWLPQAQQGNAEAQTYVGEIYEKGLGVAPDFNEAVKWYEKAAAQGSSRAQINLGYLYEKGYGVDQDVAKALNLYRDASGLTDDNLTYESTVEIETQQRMGEARKQIEALQRDYENSRIESERLRSKLGRYESQLGQERRRLNRALDDLDKARRETKKLESKPSSDPQSNRNLDQQRRQLELAQAEVLKERTRVKNLEQKYQQQTQQLSSKLNAAEAKAATYQEKLDQQAGQEASQRKAEIAAQRKRREEAKALDAKLAQKEKQLRAQLNKTLDELDATQKKLATAKNQPSSTNLQQEIVKYQKELDNKQAEALQQRQRLAAMEQEHEREKQLLSAKLSAAEERSQGYQRSLEQNLKEREALNAKLARTERELKEVNQRLQKSENSLKQKQSSVDTGQVEKLKRDLAREQKLKDQKNKELIALQAKIRDIESTSSAQAVAQPATPSRPKIVLVDPSLSAIKTRGRDELAVKLRSAVPSREIVGRVEAAAGIMSLLVNDRPEKVNEAGLFKTRIALSKKQTPVNITLIDKAGDRATLDFVMIPGTESKGGAQKRKKARLRDLASDINFGSYHALLIGNEQYANLPTLDTPIDDIQEIAGILRKKYNFKTTVLTNANRYDVLSALNKLRGELTEETNLLIYYAGHGEIDKVNQRGQWLPVDAEMDNNANWISTAAITDILNSMSVQHIMVVADSCYSGAMTRTSLARLNPGMSAKKKLAWLKTMTLAKSRTVLTSGGVKPVLDAGADGHSIFAKALIDTLKRNSDILEGQDLYRQISGNVKKAAKKVGFDQTPQYGPIRYTGHEAGEFFFIPTA